MRGKKLIWICLTAILLSSALLTGISIAPSGPEMYVEPAITQSNPGEWFTVDVKVKDIPAVPGVAAWEFKLQWNVDLTDPENFPPDVTEGGFLKTAGPTAMYMDAQYAFKYIMVGALLTVPGSAWGTGTLATINFTVTESGTSTFHLMDTVLLDQADVKLVHTTTDGMFYTTKPYVKFGWAPDEPLPNIPTIFDATGCFDPDNLPETGPADPTPGPIASYDWDFGDGDTGSGLIAEHTYADYRDEPYMVSLTVTDDDGETWTLTKPLRIWRDVAIVDIWPSIDWFDSVNNEYFHGQPNYYDDPLQYMDVLVTVVNIGTVTQVIHCYLYADLYTDVIGDEYQIHWFGMNQYDHMTRQLAPDTGTGWAGDFIWWLDYSSIEAVAPGIHDVGDFTLTAEVFTAEDQDLSNNVMTYGFPIHIDPGAGVKSITPETKCYHVKNQDGYLDLMGKVQNFEKPDSVYAELTAKVVFEMSKTGTLIEVESDTITLGNDEIGSVYATWDLTEFTEDDYGTYSGLAVCYFWTEESPDLVWEGVKRISFTIKVTD